MSWFVKPYYELPDGGIRPKKLKFSFAKHPYHLTDSSLIDTNAVYLELSTNVYYGTKHVDSSYIVHRFWDNGKLFISYAYEHKPSDTECNNATYGLIGYYKIVEKEITMEIYTTEDHGSYNFYYGEIYGDRIILTHWKPRAALNWKLRLNPYEVLTKHKVRLTSRPDW